MAKKMTKGFMKAVVKARQPKSASKKKTVPPKKTARKAAVKKTPAKPARKTAKKTVKAAQSTRKRVAAEKAPRKKGGKEFVLKPAIPIDQVKHVIARIQIPALIQEIREYDEQTAEIMEELGPSLEAISELRTEALAKLVQLSKDARIEAVEGSDWRMSYVVGESKRLDQTKLLELGVKMATIQKAIVTTPNKPYVRISKKGETAPESNG